MDIIRLEEAQQDDLFSRLEGHFFDFKRAAIEVSKLQRTFVAFANADGGEIYVGIACDRELAPADRIDGFLDLEAANAVTRIPESLLKPSLFGVEFEFCRLPARPDRLVLHVIIPKSDRVHYTSNDQCFKRHNAENLPVVSSEIEKLLFTKGQKSYEDTLVESVTLNDLLASEYFRTYLERIPSAQPADQFLIKQKVVSKGRGKSRHALVAGVLLFDDLPQASLASKCGVKISRIRTSQAEYDRRFLEGQPLTIDGPAEVLINTAVKTIQRMMATSRLKLRGGQFRKYRYPIEAIHEVVANAVIHRDYHISDDVHVQVFDNRIEVSSPGKLPGHVTVDNIRSQRFLRNNQLARLLNKLPDAPNKDIGEGLDTAFKSMQDARLKDPVIEELQNSVRVILLHEDIASREEQIVAFLEKNPAITNKLARSVTGVQSEQAIFKVFRRLLQAKVIELVDPDSNAFDRSYRLTTNWQERFNKS